MHRNSAMDPIEGFIYIILFIGLLAFLSGGGVAVAAAAVLRHLENRLLRAAVIAAGMVLGYLLFMQTDVFWLLIGALIIGTPMAVLVPPLLIFDRNGKNLRLSHILLCYGVVAVPGILLPFTLLTSDLSLPFGGVLLYLCLLLADIAAASAVHLLIGRISAVLRRSASSAR